MLSKQALLQAYRKMREIRTFEERFASGKYQR
jgi:TPP-dependent pyruvate/acetoin dehydrogenase alpha subunit